MKGKKIQMPEGLELKELEKGLYLVVETPQKKFQDDDWVLFYDKLKSEQDRVKHGYIDIQKFKNTDDLPWIRRYKIDLDQPLQPQLDEFLKLK